MKTQQPQHKEIEMRTISSKIWKALCKHFLAIIGWILIGALFYKFVYEQLYLIENFVVLSVIGVLGLLFSFMFSCSEMAITTFDENELRQLSEELENKDLSEKKSRTAHKKNVQLMDIYFEKDTYIPAIVIGNNIANVFLTALIPLAYDASKEVQELSLPLPFTDPTYILEIPGAGTETLTLFSILLLIIIFGEILPKEIGRKNSLTLVRALLPVINITKIWLPLTRAFTILSRD